MCGSVTHCNLAIVSSNTKKKKKRNGWFPPAHPLHRMFTEICMCGNITTILPSFPPTPKRKRREMDGYSKPNSTMTMTMTHYSIQPSILILFHFHEIHQQEPLWWIHMPGALFHLILVWIWKTD